jgi:hypothetical protein
VRVGLTRGDNDAEPLADTPVDGVLAVEPVRVADELLLPPALDEALRDCKVVAL